MKKHSLYPLLIALILFNINVYSQNSISDITANNNLVNEESAVKPPKLQDFIKQFEIITSNGEMAKILGEVYVYSDPELNPENKIFEIHYGSLVETYKFYPK